MAMPSQLHADLAELAFLLGDWSGTGEGIWPPGERFDYAEDVTFEFVGDPFLLYAQRSWSLDDGSPIHFERGFLRPAGPGIVELLLAHPIGITEVAVGTVDGGLIELSSSAVSLAPGQPGHRAPSPHPVSRRRPLVRAPDGDGGRRAPVARRLQAHARLRPMLSAASRAHIRTTGSRRVDPDRRAAVLKRRANACRARTP
jgi:hypothetical protein